MNPKPFAWSFSALDGYELCPKKYYHERVAKSVKQETTKSGDWGSDAHKALEERLVRKRPLPLGMQHYEPTCQMILDMPGQVYGEQKTAINRDYRPTDYWANDVWCRALADVLVVNGPNAVAIDWKFGRQTDSWHDQGLINAMMAFCQLPQLQTCAVAFVWFKESGSNPPVSSHVYSRSSILDPWQRLLGRVARLEQAVATTDFPARENYLCKRYCPVTSCPYNGRRGAVQATAAGTAVA
jgi:hypothetical protein